MWSSIIDWPRTFRAKWFGAAEQIAEVEPLVLRHRPPNGGPAATRPSSGSSAPGRPVVHQLDRPGRFALAQDQALLHQRVQMAHHAVGRLDVERLADLAHGRPVAARLDLLADELVNLSLALRQLAEVRHGSPFRQSVGGGRPDLTGSPSPPPFGRVSAIRNMNLSILDARTQKKRKFWSGGRNSGMVKRRACSAAPEERFDHVRPDASAALVRQHAGRARGTPRLDGGAHVRIDARRWSAAPAATRRRRPCWSRCA